MDGGKCCNPITRIVQDFQSGRAVSRMVLRRMR